MADAPAALSIVTVATSFGGLHSTAERRARWGGDDVAAGFIRFSCGGEDAVDLVADVEQALAKCESPTSALHADAEQA